VILNAFQHHVGGRGCLQLLGDPCFPFTQSPDLSVEREVEGYERLIREPAGGIAVNRRLLFGFHPGDPIGEPFELSREVLMLVILAAFEPLHARDEPNEHGVPDYIVLPLVVATGDATHYMSVPHAVCGGLCGAR
jgi:hypothetical protein